MFSRPLLPILLILLLVLLAWWRLDDGAQISRTALVMGTLVEIRAYGEDLSQLERAAEAALGEMNRLEQLFSTHLPQSEISRLTAATESLQVSQETADLIALGLEIGRKSHGAFDPSLGRLKRLWDIEGESPRVPDAEALKQALRGAGPDALQVHGQLVTKRSAEVSVDLGGIAKGYAVDRAVATLAAAGVRSAAVNAGGDIRLLGDREGQPWRIGIQHPRKSHQVAATLSLENKAVVTSGDYERFFEQDGIRYHHLFDPRTGRPARLCQSVTIVADDAASADALATAVFVLGPEQGMRLLDSLPGVDGLIITADSRRIATKGLQGALEWQ